MNPEIHHEPSEISYDEQFYPARPRPLKPSVRRAARVDAQSGEPVPDNPKYVEWLINQSILHDAKLIAEQLSGKGSMWQNPYADPNPRAAVERGSVWFTAYPISIITAPGASFLSSLGDESLWQAFSDIGVTAVHTGPVKQAGGIDGWRATPSVDGHFDRISMQIDSAFGTEDEFRKLCVVAAAYDASSSTTSSPVTRVRAPTSGSPRWRTPTIPASITWWRSNSRTGTCFPACRTAGTR